MRARKYSPLVVRGLLALLTLVVVLVATRTKPHDSRSPFFSFPGFLKIREGATSNPINESNNTYHSIIEKATDAAGAAEKVAEKALGYYTLFSDEMAKMDEADLDRMRTNPSEKLRFYTEATNKNNRGKTTTSVEVPLEYSISVRTTIDAYQRYIGAFYTSHVSQAVLELKQYFTQYGGITYADEFINKYLIKLSQMEFPTIDNAPAPTTSAPAPTTSNPAPTTSNPAPTTSDLATSNPAPTTSNPAPATPAAIPFKLKDLIDRLTYDQVYFNAKIVKEMHKKIKFSKINSELSTISLDPLFGNSGVRQLILETFVPYYANTYMPKFHEKFGVSISADKDVLIKDAKNILFVIGCLSMYHVLDNEILQSKNCNTFHITYGMYGVCEEEDNLFLSESSYKYSMELNPYVFHVNKGGIHPQKTPNGKTYAKSNDPSMEMEKVRFIHLLRRNLYKNYSQILDSIFFDRMFADFNDHKTSVTNFVMVMNELDLFGAKSIDTQMENIDLNTKECAPVRVEDSSDTEQNVITITDDTLESYNSYKNEITVDLMRVGAMRFCVEFTNALMANRVEHIVGDVRSLSRTARASYEAKESLDLGDFYY